MIATDLTAHLSANAATDRVRVVWWLRCVIDVPPPDVLDDNAIRATASELAYVIRYRLKPSAGAVSWLRRMASCGDGGHEHHARLALALLGGCNAQE